MILHGAHSFQFKLALVPAPKSSPQEKRDINTSATPPSPKRARTSLEGESQRKADSVEQKKGIQVDRWFAQISTHIVGVAHYKGGAE